MLSSCIEIEESLRPSSLWTSGSFPSSIVGGLAQSFTIGTGTQGTWNSGRLGNLQATSVILGRFQIATGPPHPGHQMTGTTVDELSPSLLVVSQALLEIPLPATTPVETLSGIVVTVDVGIGFAVSIPEDSVLLGIDSWLDFDEASDDESDTIDESLEVLSTIVGIVRTTADVSEVVEPPVDNSLAETSVPESFGKLSAADDEFRLLLLGRLDMMELLFVIEGIAVELKEEIGALDPLDSVEDDFVGTLSKDVEFD